MTPAERLGYKVGDEFEIIHDFPFKIGDKVRLVEDDGSCAPRFEGVGCVAINGNSRFFNYLERVKPLSRITLKPGDYIATADLSEDDYHSVARAFMATGAYPLEYNEDGSLNDEWKYFGWTDDNDLEFWDNSGKYGEDSRQLTLSQILNATNAGNITHAETTTETTHMHLADRLEAAICAQSQANAEVERLQAEWRAAYPGISGCVDIDVGDIRPEDWEVGDVVECTYARTHLYTEGKQYQCASGYSGSVIVLDNCENGTGSRPNLTGMSQFKFIRRP